MEQSPLSFTTDAQLDAAVRRGWEGFLPVAKRRGAASLHRWLDSRIDAPFEVDELDSGINAILSNFLDPAERVLALAELAELLEDADVEIETALWEGVLSLGFELADAEVIYEASSRLAAIQEGYGDPLTAAEYFIQFLNWRRQKGHSSPSDMVLDAFDEIVRLAEEERAVKAAALFAHWQSLFARLADKHSEGAFEGDWSPEVPSYAPWE